MQVIPGIIASSKYVASAPAAGYKLWLDAADTSTITSSSGAVSQWTDKSANAYTFTQSTATNKPTTGANTINSKNVITFDGTNDTLVSSAAASVWKFLNYGTSTVFIVGKKTGGDGNNRVYYGTNTAGSSSVVGMYFYINTGQTYSMFVTNGNSGQYVVRTSGTSATASGNGEILINTVDTSLAYYDRWKFYQNNGTAEAPNDLGYDAANNSNPTSTLYLGSVSFGYFYGQIGEIIIYDSILSTTDREKTRNYLNAKWAIY